MRKKTFSSAREGLQLDLRQQTQSMLGPTEGAQLALLVVAEKHM